MLTMFRLSFAIAILAVASVAHADVVVSASRSPSGINPQTNILFGVNGTGLSSVPGTANNTPIDFTFTPTTLGASTLVDSTPGAATITPTSATSYSQIRIDIEAGYGFTGFEFNFDGILTDAFLRIEAIDEFNGSHSLFSNLLTLNDNGQNKFAVEATGGFLKALILTATPNFNGTGEAAIITSFKQPRVNGLALLGTDSEPPVIIVPPTTSEVPEPASLAIWGCVAAGLAVARLRNRHKSA